jgi:hypothetical protein
MNYSQFKFKRTATAAQLQEREEETAQHLAVREPEVVYDPNDQPREVDISERLVEYMRAILKHDRMPVSYRDELLGISAGTGHRIRALLKKEGLVREYQAACGTQGRNFKDLRLTDKGVRMLQRAGKNGRK